jgi:hypothetical protein
LKPPLVDRQAQFEGILKMNLHHRFFPGRLTLNSDLEQHGIPALPSLRARSMATLCLAGAVVLGLAHASAACDLPDERPAFVNVKPRDSIDTERFATEIQAAMGNRVMGYAVTLRGPAGRIIAQINGGYARTPCEAGGAKKFNGLTESPIGSVSKVFTAAYVIHRAEKLGSVSLDDPFADYLPARWRSALHPSMQPVTLRQLLGHRGGFGHSGRTYFDRAFSFEDRLKLGGESYIVRARNMALGENDCVPEWIDVPQNETLSQFNRCYANASLALWNYSAASTRPGPWAEVEAGWSPREITYDSYISVHAGRLYREGVERQLLAPAGVTGGCNEHVNDLHRAFVYDDPDDKRGVNLSDPGKPCAVGGWFMSTRALSAAVHRLVSTREVIDENHDLMFADASERLVFFDGKNVTGGRAVWHGGSRQNRAARAEVMVFPNGMVAAVIVNSRSVGQGPALDTMLLDAYEASLS